MFHRSCVPANAFAAVLTIAAGAFAPPVSASRIILTGSPTSGFGNRVFALPNGNFVVGTSGLTMYLYAADGTLIRSMATASDSRVVPLGTTAFLLVNPAWNNAAGAVTRVDASTGLTGPVSAANSIVGGSPGDNVGYSGVVVLPNGDYVVCSALAKIGGVANAGAVTRVSGSAPVYGVVSAANSLVGSSVDDNVGGGCAVALANGNYVVRSPNWKNGSAAKAGAATWCGSAGSCVGPVSVANSLVGSSVDDRVGEGVTPLVNGNYVVASPSWSSGAATYAGAATWGNGATGTTGVVSAANSLVGAAMYDNAGYSVTALRNGHYVVATPRWDNGAATDAGAITWGNGNGGLVGDVTAANSLVGATSGDSVGETFMGASGSIPQAVIPLDNGHYVVNAPFSNTAASRAGAVAWADGNGGTTGPISAANALVGTVAADRVGVGGVRALANGHYVVSSREWNNGTMEKAGAVTWGNGNGGTVGAVNASNSLVGTAPGDFVGERLAALANGHYVTSTPRWHNGGLSETGAVTWGNGNGGSVGTVSLLNSIVGTSNEEWVGENIVPLANGNYVIATHGADSNGLTNNGAATWMSGNGPAFGALPKSRSLVGAYSGAFSPWVVPFADGNFALFSQSWSAAVSPGVGGTTLLAGNSPTKGVPQAWNSTFGTDSGTAGPYEFDYDPIRHRLIVGRPSDSAVALISQEQIFADGVD